MNKINQTFICGAAATVFGQGCMRNVEPLSQEKLAMAVSNIQSGQEFILPTALELAEVSDEEFLFGFDGDGRKAFVDSLNFCNGRLSTLADHGRIFKYNDPDDLSRMFYRQRSNEERELIGVNLAYVDIVPFSQVYDGSEPVKERDYFGSYIHEGCHDEEMHSQEVENLDTSKMTSSEMYEPILTEAKDVPYLMGFFLTDTQKIFEDGYLNWRERFDAYLDGQRLNLESHANNANSVETDLKNLGNFLSQVSTPEGWSQWMVDEDSGDIFNDYLGVPIENKREVFANSGWYEIFVEPGLQEATFEAKREFGLLREAEREMIRKSFR